MSNLALTAAALILGVIIGVFGPRIASALLDPPPVESESFGGIFAATFARQGPNSSGDWTLRIGAVPFLVLNNVGGPESTIVEVRVVPLPPEGEPRIEDYEPEEFWTSESCGSAAFSVLSGQPRLIGLPERGEEVEEVAQIENNTDVQYELPYGVFLRMNDGSFFFVKRGAADPVILSAFGDETLAILEACAPVPDGWTNMIIYP